MRVFLKGGAAVVSRDSATAAAAADGGGEAGMGELTGAGAGPGADGEEGWSHGAGGVLVELL